MEVREPKQVARPSFIGSHVVDILDHLGEVVGEQRGRQRLRVVKLVHARLSHWDSVFYIEEVHFYIIYSWFLFSPVFDFHVY